MDTQKIKHEQQVTRKPDMSSINDMKHTVYNPEGEELGKIEDVIVDQNNGKIAFGVLSFGGLFGIGDTRYAIPWEALEYHDDDRRYTLNISKEQLEKAEGYNEETFRKADDRYLAGMYGYWGYSPYWRAL